MVQQPRRTPHTAHRTPHTAHRTPHTNPFLVVAKTFVIAIVSFSGLLGSSLSKAADLPSTNNLLETFLQPVSGTRILDSSFEVELQGEVYPVSEVIQKSALTGQQVRLPLFDNEYYMTVTKVRPGSSGVQTYSTVLNDREGGQVGTALLTHGAGLFYGLITTKDGIYQVQPSSEQPESPHLLQKMRQVSVKGITDFEFPDRQNEWDRLVEYDNGSMQQTLSTNSTVDVLVLFTPTVRARKLGTTPTINWINAMISDYNEKLLELGVTSFTLSLKGALETKWPTFSVPYHENNTHNGSITRIVIRLLLINIGCLLTQRSPIYAIRTRPTW